MLYILSRTLKNIGYSRSYVNERTLYITYVIHSRTLKNVRRTMSEIKERMLSITLPSPASATYIHYPFVYLFKQIILDKALFGFSVCICIWRTVHFAEIQEKQNKLLMFFFSFSKGFKNRTQQGRLWPTITVRGEGGGDGIIFVIQ